jgi:hypothetical protein
MQHFDFVRFPPQPIATFDEEDTNEAILQNIAQGIDELNLINQGHLTTRPAKELISTIQ